MRYHLQWLIDKFDRNDQIQYIFFWGHSNKADTDVGKFLFSQWYPSPFVVDGIEYKSAEHWMMAKKALLFNDQENYEKIIKALKPPEVKAIGRQILNYNDAAWDKEKFAIVVEGNVHKFGQTEKYRQYLITTGDRVLVEASPVDNVWGIGLAQDSKRIEDPNTWKGSNLLGFALMEARDALRG